MKSVLHANANQEFAENHKMVGNPGNPVKYTKNDFLDAKKVAEMFGISTAEATKFMRILCIKHTLFGANGHKAPVVIRTSKTGNNFSLHPMAHEIFQEFLTKQRG